MRRRLLIILALSLWATPSVADTIKLANGDELNGEIIEWAVDYIVVRHPQLGDVRLSLDQLDLDTGPPPSPGFFGTRFLRGWKREIDLGWTGRNGDTDTLNITAGLNFGYADEFKRWKINGRYYYNDSSDGDQDNNARLDVRRDWLFPGHDWFAFASLRYQFDQFEDWKNRTVLSIGPGYNIVETESHQLDVRLAPTFTKEYSGDKDSKGEALFGVDWSWVISSRSSLNFTNDFYVEWKPDAGAIRNLTVTEWQLGIVERPALKLKIGGSNEYDSRPDGGDDPNDLRYYLSMGLDF